MTDPFYIKLKIDEANSKGNIPPVLKELRQVYFDGSGNPLENQNTLKWYIPPKFLTFKKYWRVTGVELYSIQDVYGTPNNVMIDAKRFTAGSFKLRPGDTILMKPGDLTLEVVSCLP